MAHAHVPNIRIDTNLLREKFSQSAFAAYVAIKLSILDGCDLLWCTPTSLSFVLTQDSEDPYMAKVIKKGLDELDMIYILGTGKRHIYNISMMISQKQFVYVTKDAIFKIMNHCDAKINNITLLYYYVCLLSTIYKTDKYSFGYGYCSIETLSDRFNIARSSISKYNSVLEALELIYIYKSGNYTKNANGTAIKYGDDSNSILYKKIANRYGRFEDKKEIEKLARTYDALHGVTKRKE